MTPSPRGENTMINRERQNLCKVITEWEIDNWISQSQAGRLRHWVANKDSINIDHEFFKELREAHEYHVQEVLNNAE
tara:strand:- start:563 stop:793 length:231 start_codon:yes stop_codon:yes gene_type:complete